MLKPFFPVVAVGGLLLAATTSVLATPRLADLRLPGPPAFQRVARDVLDATFAIDPSQASGAGLADDAARVPHYGPTAVAALEGRVRRDLAALRAMPWHRWPVAQQVDFRWIYANAETVERMLQTERLYTHREAQWLEPTANNLIALLTYAPERLDVQARVWSQVPSMLHEMESVCTSPTSRDVSTATEIVTALLTMSQHPAMVPTMQTPAGLRLNVAMDEAKAALTTYRDELQRLHDLPEFTVIGADNYRWRYAHSLLLPWTPQQLLDMATRDEARTTAEVAALKPTLEPEAPPTAQQQEEARALTRDSLLALYDAIPVADHESLLKSGVVTYPVAVGPIHARETPDAMVPLTGDGGSMNPPPPFGSSNVGYWNVEHFQPTWTQDERLEKVLDAENFRTNGMGPYSAHEGVPGHHLQLSLARLNPDPIRSLMSDAVENEGWALYAEDMFWQSGGLGSSVRAHYNTLESFLFRIRRVTYDVKVETRAWTLQQAADYRHRTAPGQGKVDPDVLRAINWPTQLISYYAGKMQILQLKADYRKKLGPRYTERRFHDALLHVGSIPYVFARAEMLGDPVPDI